MYREAKALKTLHAEVNALAPLRSTASDGWIGDDAHATRDSDHNPWVLDAKGRGVVRARDFTHDPKGGLDCHGLARQLAKLLGKHPAMGAGAYIIWSGRIISTNRLREGWRPYTGANKHTKHLHVSVGLAGYDATAPWLLKPPTRVSRARDLLVNVLRDLKPSSLRARRIRAALDELPPR